LDSAVAVVVAFIAAGLSLVSVVLNIRSTHRLQVRATRQALTLARWEAYAGYLVAQQSMHPVLRNVEETEHDDPERAYDEYLNQRRDSNDADLYTRSGDTEMRARLLADHQVGKAISDFEAYVEAALKHRLVPPGKRKSEDRTQASTVADMAYTLSDKDWDGRLLALVATMNGEQIADWWGERK